MSKKYIIGNGISGLIWKYYNPEFQIIAPTPAGGIYASSHLVWLHDSPETRDLVTKLGLPYTLKQSRIGYYHGGWIADNVNDEINLTLIQKKMSKWDGPLDTSFKPRDRKLSLSTGGVLGASYMNTIDVDLEEFIKRLNKNTDVIDGLVIRIS